MTWLDSQTAAPNLKYLRSTTDTPEPRERPHRRPPHRSRAVHNDRRLRSSEGASARRVFLRLFPLGLLLCVMHRLHLEVARRPQQQRAIVQARLEIIVYDALGVGGGVGKLEVAQLGGQVGEQVARVLLRSKESDRTCRGSATACSLSLYFPTRRTDSAGGGVFGSGGLPSPCTVQSLALLLRASSRSSTAAQRP